MTHYTIKPNKRARTYTIRRYDSGKLTAKYRTYQQSDEVHEFWTQADIAAFLSSSHNYYSI